MLIGWNANPRVVIPQADLIRFPLWLDRMPGLVEDYDKCLQHSAQPLLVLDRNSFTDLEWQEADYEGRVQWWWEQFHRSGRTQPRYIQAGNEPDHDGPASSTQSLDDYHKLGEAVCKVWSPASKVVAAGLVHVDFEYFMDIAIWADIAAVHPYAKWPGEDLTVLINACFDCLPWHFPLWVTEFGIPQTAYDGEDFERALYHREMLHQFRLLGLGAAVIYRYDDCGDGFANENLGADLVVRGATI